MTLSAHLTSWVGNAYRHIPNDSAYDVLDFRFAGLSAENRWNLPGQPTLYLAGDEGILIAEWGRHFAVNRTPELQTKTVERPVFRLTLSIGSLLDLRDPAVWRELSLENAPHAFLDRDLARATSNFVRASTPAQGLLVPPVGFLDQPDRWSLVLFLEKLPDPGAFISAVMPRGLLRRA